MSNPYDSPQTNTSDFGGPPPNPNPVLAIVSLVTGIISLIPGCCCGLIGIPMALVAIGTGIAGIVMANSGKASGKGMAIAGVILGGLYVLVFIVSLILNLAGVVSPDAIEEMMRELENQ